MTMNGIDISSAQASMDVTKVNADFVIVKATQGVNYVNPCCDKHYQQAKQSGKLRGVYHYANGGNAIDEANFFLKNIQGYIKDALLALDWERDLGGGFKNPVFGTAGAPTWIKTWCDYVFSKTGVRPLVYVQATALHDVAGIGDYGLWVAQYANYNVTYYQEHPWNEGAYSCAIRQYAGGNGRVDGYSGAVDLDKFYGDAAAWNKYANPSGSYKPASPTPSKTVKTYDEIAHEVIAGVWGNGDVRKQKLAAAGYDYNQVQKRVNALLATNTSPKKTNEQIAAEVLAGKWGNGDDRKNRLTSAGYNYSAVQTIVDKKLHPAKKSNDQIANEVIAGKWGDGNDRKNRLASAGYDYNAIQGIVNQKLGASQAIYHNVKPRENLTMIAAMYGTTVQNIVNMNGIANPDLIFVGQRLRVK